MDLFLDILQALGVAAAVGLRPFLATIAVGALALGDVGVDFDGTSFAFLESPVFLAGMAVLLVASLLLRLPWVDTAVAALAVVLGALLAAGTIDDREDVWWYGLLLGAALAAVGALASRELLARVRARFAKSGETSAAASLPVYAEGAGFVGALLSVLLPPVGLLVAGFVVALLVQQRRRAGEKYAGLRILR
jgi:hypothetical protein